MRLSYYCFAFFNSGILNLILSNSNRWSRRKKEYGAEKMIKINPIPLHNTQQKITDVKLHQTLLKHRAELPGHTKYVTSPPPTHNNVTPKQLVHIHYQNRYKKPAKMHGFDM
jgi:hypothetical protein